MTSVLHLCAPASVGGLESVVASLAASQEGRGHEVSVGAVVEPEAGDHPFLARLREAGVPHHPLRIPHRRYLREIRGIRALLRERRPDVVHTHGYRGDVIGGHVARREEHPVVSTVHGFTGGGIKNRVYEILQRLSLRRFQAVVAVSRPLGRELEAWGVGAERVHVVPNAWAGEPELLGREEARRRLGLPGDAWVIGWVGRLDRLKGGDVLIRALPHLDGEDVQVSLVGEGPEREALRQMARELDIRHRVRLHGLHPNAAALYRAFDVFVLSSRSEGTPISLLEALYAEVPVVATRVGGVTDVVGPEEALLVPPEAPGALASALEEVRQQPERASERARRGHRRLEVEFGRERWLDRYDDIYRDVLGHSKTEPSP